MVAAEMASLKEPSRIAARADAWGCQRQRASKVCLAKNSDLPEGGQRSHSPVQEAVDGP